MLLIALVAGSAIAAGTWVAVAMRGTVLTMAGNQWSELPLGTALAEGVPVRTLQGALVSLRREAVTLGLGPNSAVQIDQPTPKQTVITQFAGTVEIDALIPSGQRLMLKASTMTVSMASGHSKLLVSGDAGTVLVEMGEAVVLDLATGVREVAIAGEEVTLAGAAATEANSNAGANAAGNGNNGGNAGGNGNGNADGSGNGNAGGNGNGNADGNGNGNADGNGNGNAGGNGNGNAGGNGNGNGNKSEK